VQQGHQELDAESSQPCWSQTRMLCTASARPCLPFKCTQPKDVPVQAFGAGDSFHPHGSTVQPGIRQDRVVQAKSGNS